jgi:hypothetical protein
MAVDSYISNIRKRDIIAFVCGILSGFVLFLSLSSIDVYPSHSPSSSLRDNNNDRSGIPIPMDPFPEEPWRTPATLAARVG